MSFTVQIPAGVQAVEPGQSAPVAVTVTNTGSTALKLEVVLEGIDAEWTAVPVPQFSVEPGQSEQIRVFLKPPRTSESLAGMYPYVVMIRDLDTGDWRRTQGVLEVKPYVHFSLDMNPKRVACRFRSPAFIDVSVMNLGNSEHNIQFFANDQDGIFVFSFENDTATLGAGQQKEAFLTVTPAKASLFSSPILSPFSVTVRSADQPSAAASVQGQAEQRALLAPGPIAILILILVLGWAWVQAAPKPPRVQAISVPEARPLVGKALTITWVAVNASTVTLSINGQDIDRQPASGTYEYIPTEPGNLDILVTAFRDGLRSTSERKIIEVKEIPKAPKPEILAFNIQPREVMPDKDIQVSFKFSPSVVRATLSPFIGEIDPKTESRIFKINAVGPHDVKLIAYNADGVSVDRTIRIAVVDRSLATFTAFFATPKEIEPDSIVTGKVSWELVNAVRADIKVGTNPSVTVDPLKGTYEFEISAPTTVTMTIYDVNGKSATRTTKIGEAKAPVVAPPPDGTNDSTTGGQTPPTTGTIPPN